MNALNDYCWMLFKAIVTSPYVRWLWSAWVRYPLLAIGLGYVVTLGLGYYGFIEATMFQRQTDGATYVAAGRNLALIYVALVVGPLGLLLAVERSITARRQSDIASQQAATAEKSERNGRFQKGSEMLGSTVLPVRLGGIYSLRELAGNDATTYLRTITDLFCAFVRTPPHGEEKSFEIEKELNLETGEVKEHEAASSTPIIRQDLQAILTILGSEEWVRSMKRHGVPRSALDLRSAFLPGADLFRVDLRDANLFDANLFGADLRRANLSGDNLSSADLRGASLRVADLSGTDLFRADLIRIDLDHADLSGADLRGADLRGASLIRVNLDGTRLNDANLHGAKLSNAGLSFPATIIPKFFISHQFLSQAQYNTTIGTPRSLPDHIAPDRSAPTE